MVSELQSLLDKIQAEGVNKAEKKAAKIIADAEAKAAEIIAVAEKQAATIEEKAKEEARASEFRSQQSVKQASRDIILGLEQAIQQTFERALKAEVEGALSAEYLTGLVDKLVANYLTEDENIELVVSPADAEKLAAYVQSKFAAAAAQKGGVQVRADKDISAGICVMLDEGRVEHDFTSAAVLDKLSQLIRPALIKLISEK